MRTNAPPTTNVSSIKMAGIPPRSKRKARSSSPRGAAMSQAFKPCSSKVRMVIFLAAGYAPARKATIIQVMRKGNVARNRPRMRLLGSVVSWSSWPRKTKSRMAARSPSSRMSRGRVLFCVMGRLYLICFCRRWLGAVCLTNWGWLQCL